MNRFFSALLPVLLIIATFLACSTTSQTANRNTTVATQDSVDQRLKSAPTWYKEEGAVFGSSAINSYATAIDSDSASTVSKAVERGTTLLRQAVSNRIETVRSKAMEELGSESGLNKPGFLIALRKADSAVYETVTTQQTGTEPIEGQESVRGFSNIQVDRAELINLMGNQLSSHQESWNALINSEAFANF
jgi:hypothetical protein